MLRKYTNIEYFVNRAKYIYENLDKVLHEAQSIAITPLGTKDEIYGETKFICQNFPDVLLVDDNHAGASIYGRTVISTSQFKDSCRGIVINNAKTYEAWNQVERLCHAFDLTPINTLEVLCVLRERGITLDFCGLFAVYGPSFHKYTYENYEKCLRLLDHFKDDLSKNTILNLLKLRLSGNLSYLSEIAVGMHGGIYERDSYILNKDFFKFSDNETFLDGGGLVGDSTESFIRTVGGKFEHIYIFEPLRSSAFNCHLTIDRLSKEFVGRGIKRKCTVIPKGLFSFSGTLQFTSSLYSESVTELTGRMPQSAHIIQTGLSDSFSEKKVDVHEIPVVKIDDYFANKKITFIKLEIEGSEVDTLIGAIETIKRNRPKMALSVYHRPEDLNLIIEYVVDLDLDYKMAIRAHNPNCPDAVVLYCW